MFRLLGINVPIGCPSAQLIKFSAVGRSWYHYYIYDADRPCDYFSTCRGHEIFEEKKITFFVTIFISFVYVFPK